jgi:hypothetical protein
MKPQLTNRCLIMALSLLSCFINTSVKAQYAPGLPAAFGIDGDVLSGQSQNISGSTSQGSFDWFRKNGGGTNAGVGIIDTTGTSGYATQVFAGQNLTFTRGMAFSRYSSNNGYLLLDARYGRDNYGLSNSPGKSDLTTYISGAKNGDNPTSWTSTPSGGTVADKADIIDTYIHMRRNGTVINNTNPSHLILAMGINTIGNTGNRYVDFELFRSRIEYNPSTGNFSNSGNSSTGGHTAWQFNSNGTVKDIGDISVSFAFGTLGVTEISVYIWVSQSEFNTIMPSNFNFTAGEFYGSTYGYAKVTPKSSNAFQAWGTASSGNTGAAPWGTNSKTNGTSPTDYSASHYAALDFAEVAIDLTSLGVDPALSVGMDPCVPPYTRVMAKSRSSSSFTSALQDFTGPYEFLDAPMASPQIANPANLKCNIPTVTLSAAVPVAGATYQWTTTNGNIVSNPNATSITVDKAGKYFLTSAIVAGCPTRTDSTIVNSDYYKPVATASVTGLLSPTDPLSYVILQGGDVSASNFATPYGGSAGLDWKWTGPNNFTSNVRNPSATIAGTYNLELTEMRNGCKDVALVPVAFAAVLPVKYASFTAEVFENKLVILKWVTASEINNSHFEVERSFGNNSGYVKIGTVAQSDVVNNGKISYQYNDASKELKGKQIIFYRLKQVDLDGKATYSEVLAVKLTGKNDGSLQVFPNPFADNLELRFSVSVNTYAEIRIVSMTGKLILINRTKVNKGPVQVKVKGLGQLNAGAYIAQLVINGSVVETQKIIKN